MLPKLFWPTVIIFFSGDWKSFCQFEAGRQRICKNFDITGIIYLDNERSEQFSKQKPFLTCYLRFLRKTKMPIGTIDWDVETYLYERVRIFLYILSFVSLVYPTYLLILFSFSLQAFHFSELHIFKNRKSLDIQDFFVCLLYLLIFCYCRIMWQHDQEWRWSSCTGRTSGCGIRQLYACG